MKKLVEKRRREVANAALAAVEKWVGRDNGTSSVRARVDKLLNADIDALVAKLLGFDTRHYNGVWGLDHCNGRAGESAAGDYLREKARAAVSRWLSTVMDKATPLELSEEETRALRNEYADFVKTSIRKKLGERAEALAESILERESDKVLERVLREELGVELEMEGGDDPSQIRGG